jgi:Rps23 Pro-64 3,4-dihydroxylase Tpa1-like proline 4-hydroxylase
MDKCVYVKDDHFTDDELNIAWSAMESLRTGNILMSAEKSPSAKDGDGNFLKQTLGMAFRDHPEVQEGQILSQLARKIFQGDTGLYSTLGLWERQILSTNVNQTVLHYYEHSDYYLPHRDNSAFTCLIWLYKEPRRFAGGDFRIDALERDIELKNNRLVIFPSCFLHSVTPLSMKPDDLGKGLGRYCLTTFLYINGW